MSSSLLGPSYDSSSDDESQQQPPQQPVPSPDAHPVPPTTLDAAPHVSIEDSSRLSLMLADPTSTSLTYNATYDDLSRPALGPVNPFRSSSATATAGPRTFAKRKNVLTGHAEETVISDATFTAAHRTFQSLGYAPDPSNAAAVVGDVNSAIRNAGRSIVQMRPSKEASAELRRKRQRKGDSSIVEGEGAYLGPWAKYENDDPLLEDHEVSEDNEGAEDDALDEEYVEPGVPAFPVAPMDKSATEYGEDLSQHETTTFHGSQQFDYMGRTYMHVPQDLDVDLKKDVGSIKNYIPKKLIHTYRSHTKPITSLRFFPGSGHLLLSSAADGKVKLWDVYHERELLRTFSGHTKSVSDTTFNPSGTTFLSASYDRQIKLWDTEYGKCLGRFSTGKTPHVIRFNPDPDHCHEFIAGMSDKKIVQWDTRTGQITQEYDHHLAAVNTLTFVDRNRRFISTSDDKSLRAWEYNIPVPIKFIAEPYLFALTRAAPHPNGKYVAFQSGDNQIVVYASTEKFRQNRKKSFRGHNNAGYAIDLALSPDGQFLMSGDSGGYVCFWDWKTCKLYHKIQAGGKDGAATTCLDWHPQETSKIVTGGLEGVIKFWD